MQEHLFLAYYLCLAASTIAGIIRYRQADNALRVIVILLVFTGVCETASYLFYKLGKYEWRTLFYHFSSVIMMMIVLTYFLTLLKPSRPYRLLALVFPVWLVLASLNVIFLEPLTALNTNMLMLEGFVSITLSLFSIYHLLRMDVTTSIFLNPHFWVAVSLLMLYSNTFFFWAFIKILYSSHWRYMDTVLCMQIINNAILYAGIGTIFLFYPKMKKIENR